MAAEHHAKGGIPMETKTASAAETDNRLFDLTLDEANRIIALAEAYAAHLTATLGAAPADERIAEDVKSAASPAAAALIAAIEGLTRAARTELVALVWCGMGDYTFTEARAYAKATADTGIPQYLAKKALMLSGYLKTALGTLE
jgi:hypothetical protein